MSSNSLSLALVNEDNILVKPMDNLVRDGENEIYGADETISNIVSDDEDQGVTEEKHGDHSDTVFFDNPWADEWSADWANGWTQQGHRSSTNEELYENTTTQQWMEMLGSLRRDDLSMLVKGWGGSDSCSIPLFQDGENGWQYQISLAIGSDQLLPRIRCPSELSDEDIPSLLFKLRKRIKPETSLSEGGTTPLEFIVILGTLAIRSDARSPQYWPTGYYITETTDYTVVVDVGHDNMPLWLLAPRPQLQKRLDNPFYHTPICPLPIFGGLMEREGDCGYDYACILSSIRRLGKRAPDTDAPEFQSTCDLVHKTREIADPAFIMQPRETLQAYIGGREVPDIMTVVPYAKLRYLKGGTEGSEQQAQDEGREQEQKMGQKTIKERLHEEAQTEEQEPEHKAAQEEGQQEDQKKVQEVQYNVRTTGAQEKHNAE